MTSETTDVKLIPEVIETMAKGAIEERTKCPVCEGEKDPMAWICQTCFKSYGYGLMKKVQKAVVEWAFNKVDNEVREKLLKTSRLILSSPDKPEKITDKELVVALKPNFPGVPDEAIFAALAVTRKEMEREKKEAAKKAAWEKEHQERWQNALATVRTQFPNGDGGKINPSFFRENPVRFNGNFISDNMMKAACTNIVKERERAKRSSMTAAFVNSVLEKNTS